MPRVIWTPNALRDIQRLYQFQKDRDQRTAQMAIKKIRTAMNILAHQPEVGRPVEGMDPEFREWPIDFGGSGYLALYRFDGDTAVILTVRHQKEVGY